MREKQKQQTRLAIIRKAFELFGKQGYAAVSVELICEAVGISRATFFNYFPQKDLILREIARSRVEKLKSIVARFAAGGHKVSFPDIVSLFLEIAEENARMTAGSRRLILELWFRQIAHGPMMESREEALVNAGGRHRTHSAAQAGHAAADCGDAVRYLHGDHAGVAHTRGGARSLAHRTRCASASKWP